MAEETKTLINRVRDFFGMTATQCRTEYVQLTDQDKLDLVEEFNKAGMPTVLTAANLPPKQ